MSLDRAPGELPSTPPLSRDDRDGRDGRDRPATRDHAREAHRRLAAVRAHVRQRLAERGTVTRQTGAWRVVTGAWRAADPADVRPARAFPEESRWAFDAYYDGPTLQHTPSFY